MTLQMVRPRIDTNDPHTQDDAAVTPTTLPSASDHNHSSTENTAPRDTNPRLLAWVQKQAKLLQPSAVHWCDGSQAERDHLIRNMLASGTLSRVNPDHRHYSFIARSDPSDVARVEDRTFICSAKQEDAGPNNNWQQPDLMRATLHGLFAGAMRGRTLYVMPFSMAPVDSPFAVYGVQLTDSPYVVVSTGTMTRMGTAALRAINEGSPWVPAVHSVGAPLAEGEADVPWPCNSVKYIAHFPETREIFSYGSAYGGNAILAKKSLALRIASIMARDEGWLAEHMLLLRLTSPAGRTFHLAGAFPSACGKTNLAMLRPKLPGWRVETLGDDIAWLRIDDEGRLRAINPEAGFFGVAPGTGPDSNPTALDTLWGNTIFTNVATRDDGDVWWEGLTQTPPAHLIDWRGRDWTPQSRGPAAHPNGRFTVSAEQCPSIAADWDDGRGVVIDAIVFGGRRASNVPLVVEARDWEQGVYFGASLASERTAAQEGSLGELRRDPFAMLPFTGYNMAEHWAHWLNIGEKLRKNGTVPCIFQVNWFRKSDDGRYLWPGFGENLRVLAWMLDRVAGTAGAVSSPLGRIPGTDDLDLTGLDISETDQKALFNVNPAAWTQELDDADGFFAQFGDRLPEGIRRQHEALRTRISAAESSS